jgi:hypothetical protein
LIPAGLGRDENVAKMVGALIAQGVEVHRLDHELHGVTGQQVLHKANDATMRPGARPGISIAVGTPPVPPVEIPAGSYIVFVNQPYRDNVLTLFEPQAYPDRVTATGEAERPYDVAGWTLPLTMGLDCPAVVMIQENASQRKLTSIKSENEVRRDLGLVLWTTDKSPITNPVKPGIRIGIYKNSRAGNMDEGWTRFVFDTFNVPFQSVSETAIAEASPRAKFDVIVLPSEQIRATPDGEAPENPRGIGEPGYKNLARFVEDGGTLICFDGSCGQLIRQLKLPLRNVLEGVRSNDFYCPGSILRIDVDTSNPIARTMSKDTNAYFIGSSAFDVTDDGKVQVIARYAKEGILRSGWLRGEDKLKDKIALASLTMEKAGLSFSAFGHSIAARPGALFPLFGTRST